MSGVALFLSSDASLVIITILAHLSQDVWAARYQIDSLAFSIVEHLVVFCSRSKPYVFIALVHNILHDLRSHGGHCVDREA